MAARAVLYLVFAASGAAGLIYESIWSRYLGLFVGHSAYAQVIVLAIFLGGMSAGALAAGRRSERLRNPLVWYAAIELLAGLVGLVFHATYVAVTAYAHESLFPALGGSAALTAVKWSIAAALILPQSVLLGATFPLMSAGVVRHFPRESGRTIALLYFANSIGAAVGVLLEGFVLVSLVGLPGAILTAATINVAVAVVAYLAARTLGPTQADAPTVEARSGSERAADKSIAILLLVVAFGTAVASFTYEIAWIRMLSLVLGSATHAFELMLSAFILGLALGALWVGRIVDREAMPLRALAWAQWVMGVAALATLPVYTASFGWLADLMQAFNRSPQGYTGFNLARYALCLCVMLPSTFCAGMTLPLLTKALMSAGWGERAIGFVYGFNTLGSIVGVVLASLVLMPVIGLKALLVTGAVVDMVLGVLLIRRVRSDFALTAALATAAVVVLISTSVHFDRAVLASGVFRSGWVPKAGVLDVLFYRDGRTATVAVARNSWRGDLTLSTNGKPDASLSPEWFAPPPAEPGPLLVDNATQLLLSLIALAHKPEARTAVIVGLGSGSSTHFALASSNLQRLVTVEIEPAIVEGARQFYPANRRAFDDPRSEIALDDAKSYLAAAPETFDLILSEPSNPWVSGVASLFTWEFYETVARHLAPGGIFAQWLHLYEIDDGLVLTVLGALHEHFPAYEIFQVGPGDIVIIASKEAKVPVPDWSVFASPAAVEDLQRFIAFTPETLEATRVLNRAALAPLFEAGVQVNSDFFPILDLGAERARFLKLGAEGFRGIAGDRFDLTAPLVGRRPLSSEQREPITGAQRLELRARGARLRAARDTAALGRLAGGPDADPAHRLAVWQALVAAPDPPTDWRRWLADTLVVEADLHGGAAGAADDRFYAQARQYAARQKAPPAILEALAFLEGLARWDFAAVSRAADPLLVSQLQGQPLLPPDLLLNGAVIAKIQAGDGDAARAFYEALATAAYPNARDVRRRLLEAYVTRPESVRVRE